MSEQMSSVDRANRFLELFKEIESVLGGRARGGKLSEHGGRDGLGSFVRELKDRGDRQVKRYASELDAIRRLRNAIVHEAHRAGRPIAAPFDETLSSTERLLQELRSPALVTQFMHAPVTADSEDSLSEHVRFMTAQSFSQLPVVHDGQVIGLLTTNVIARWVGAHIEDGIMELQVPVRVVLEQAELRDRPKFVSRRTSAAEACDLLTSPDYPQALLVTEHGKADQGLVGIVTASDVPEMLRYLSLS